MWPRAHPRIPHIWVERVHEKGQRTKRHTPQALIKRNFLPLHAHNAPSPTPRSQVLTPTPWPHPNYGSAGTPEQDRRHLPLRCLPPAWPQRKQRDQES